MKNKINVVMLPTNKKAVRKGQLVIGAGNHIFSSREVDNIDSLTAYELYFTSDEKIKEGDYYLFYGTIFQKNNDLFIQSNEDCKKIIATNDIQLDKCDECKAWENRNNVSYTCTCKLLPKPSQQFIQQWIEEYNKGNIITEVDVEYEECSSIDDNLVQLVKAKDSHGFEYQKGLRLKVNADNTINITPIKDSWGREELPIDSLITLRNSLNTPIYKRKFGENSIIIEAIKELDKWIEENL